MRQKRYHYLTEEKVVILPGVQLSLDDAGRIVEKYNHCSIICKTGFPPPRGVRHSSSC